MLSLRSSLRVVAGLWALTVAVFLLDVAGPGMPRRLSQAVGVATVVATAAVAGAAWTRLLARDRRPAGPALATLVVVALVVGLWGIGFEVGQGYYTDEGHYVHHARLVLDGQLLARTFIYPHLSYYLDALGLWLFDLAPDRLEAAVLGGWGASPAGRDWLVLRLLGAAMGSLATIPVFLLAARVGGPLAGTLAGALCLFAVDFHDGYQVHTCDVPSAFFAALAFAAVGRLLDRERTADYLLAGAAAGLAAGAKYPAGVVAVAIAGVWVAHRLRVRGWGWGLAWAALAAIAVFLAIVPSLLVFPDAALHGQRGIFFGVRQYATGGWTGVMPPSNTLYYAGKIAGNFGLPILIVAAVGALGLAPKARRDLLVLLPFPVVDLALLVAMNMVVVRNLYPVLPALAVLIGVAASGLPALLARRAPRLRLAAATVALLAVVPPAVATLRQAVALGRPGTRALMAGWIVDNLPPGAGILKESYTPHLPEDRFLVAERRFLIRHKEERWNDPRFGYFLVASNAHGRFFRPELDTDYQAGWYRDLFARSELLHQVEPGPLRIGPVLSLYRIRRPAGRSSPSDGGGADAGGEGDADQLGETAGGGLLHDVGAMELDGLDAELQPPGDLLVRQAADDQLEDLPLA